MGRSQTPRLSRFTRTYRGAIGTTHDGSVRKEGNRLYLPHETPVGIPAPVDFGDVRDGYISDVAAHGEEILALVALDQNDEPKIEVRRVRPGAPMSIEPVPFSGPGSFRGDAKNEFIGTTRGIARFDGKAWLLVSTGAYNAYPDVIEQSLDGAIWILADESVHVRAVDGTWSERTPGSVRRLVGVNKGAPHVATLDNVYRWTASGWDRLELPAPDVPKYVLVRSADEIWVEAATQEGMSALSKRARFPQNLTGARFDDAARCGRWPVITKY